MKRISIKPDAEVTPRINYANSSSIIEDSNHVQHISLPHIDEIENAVQLSAQRNYGDLVFASGINT